jgi:hypothetical protein
MRKCFGCEASWFDQFVVRMKRLLLCGLISGMGWILGCVARSKKCEYSNSSAGEHNFPGIVLFASGY